MRPDVPWKSIVIPTPSPHFNPIGCFSLASLPQSAKFKSVLKDRMTPREFIAFAGASASVRRNEEKSAGSRRRHKGGHHHARQSPERKSIWFAQRARQGAFRWRLRFLTILTGRPAIWERLHKPEPQNTEDGESTNDTPSVTAPAKLGRAKARYATCGVAD